jgi:serine/threonine-protein kinase
MDFDPNAAPGADSADAAQIARAAAAQRVVQDALKHRYQLVRELGRGGFGVTYLATDTEVASRKVVVKVPLKRGSEDSWSLKKFKGEMEALARIDHPGVVTVVDFGFVDDERPFLVMQYVSGRSLRELIPRGGMPLERMAAIVQQAARALTAAHEVGVCHRDIKPENIMVQTLSDGEEQVKLIDFGIASMRNSDVTTGSSFGGTLEYMAPEQFRGKSSRASDIYQLGVVAYELATGIAPFRSSTPDGLVQQKTLGVKVRPRDLRADLPEAAENAILTALSPNPHRRFRRARDFGDALAASLLHATPENAGPNPTNLSTDTYPIAGHVPGDLRRWILPIAFVVLALIAGAVFWFVPQTHAASSVAVLPFQNRMDDPKMEYLTEGITESLINDLSRIPTLRVIALGSVLRYDPAKVAPLTVGRALRVDCVVRGSVSRRADELHIETELMDVRTGNRLWGSMYDATASSLSDTLEKFSTQVTDELRLKLSGSLKERRARSYATGSSSYQDYLQGRFHLNKRTQDGFETAIRYFDQAIARDSGYAPAYAGLAYTYAQLAMHASQLGSTDPVHALESARMAAQQALELDRTLAEAYTSLAFVQMQADYSWSEADETFRRAIELDPNRADAREFHALELTAQGRFDEGLREIRLAQDLEPDSWAIKAAYATILYYGRRYDESLVILDQIAKDTGSYGKLGDVIAPNYWAKSMPGEALAAVLQLKAPFTPYLRNLLLASAYARVNQEKKARELLDEFKIRPEPELGYYLALAHLGLGEKAEALQDLETDYKRRSAEILFIAVDPMMDDLRRDARFQALLARMQLNSTRH